MFKNLLKVTAAVVLFAAPAFGACGLDQDVISPGYSFSQPDSGSGTTEPGPVFPDSVPQPVQGPIYPDYSNPAINNGNEVAPAPADNGGYAPMPLPEAAPVVANIPNDGSEIIQAQEARTAAEDVMAQKQDDYILGQSRWDTADGTQIIAPSEATEVSVDQGGVATYSTEPEATAPVYDTPAVPSSYGEADAGESN